MKIALYAFGAAALALGTQPAAAQQAPAEAQAAPVSDAELEAFVIAASNIQQVSANTEIEQADKEQAMMQILSQTGMTPQRFNTIAVALETDTALQERVDQTVTRLRAEAQG